MVNKRCETVETKEEHKLRFCFIYCILMNTRWGTLSLFQRVNTVIMTENGASRKVFVYKFKLLKYPRCLKTAFLAICGHIYCSQK